MRSFHVGRDDRGVKPEPTEALKKNKLKFKIDDISYIIVEEDGQISDMVDYILRLDSIGGNEEPMSDNEKKMMLTWFEVILVLYGDGSYVG